jgi:hypothetical protein
LNVGEEISGERGPDDLSLEGDGSHETSKPERSEEDSSPPGFPIDYATLIANQFTAANDLIAQATRLVLMLTALLALVVLILAVSVFVTTAQAVPLAQHQVLFQEFLLGLRLPEIEP